MKPIVGYMVALVPRDGSGSRDSLDLHRVSVSPAVPTSQSAPTLHRARNRSAFPTLTFISQGDLHD